MSSFLSGPITVVAQELHSSSADQYHNLGAVIFSNDGRAFRYCKAGATALVAGNLFGSQAEDTGTENMTAVAAAVGDTVIVSTTTVTVTANEYAEGFIMVSVTPGVGRNYKIKGHIAFTTAAPTFNLAEEVKVALTTTSRLDAFANPFKAVVVWPTDEVAAPAGVAVHPIAIDEFGWLQVAGVGCVEAEGTVTVGLPLVASDTDAGTVESIADGAHELLATVGTALAGIADGEFGAVKISLL